MKIRHRAAAALLGVSALAAHAGTPQTVVYCIDDSTEYTSMLTALNALQAHDKNYDIRFRPGTFASHTTFEVAVNTRAQIAYRPRWITAYPQYTFRLSGEWNAGCTAQNPMGSTTSTLNGLNQYSIFYLRAHDYTASNYTPLVIEIDRMDFWQFYGWAVSTSANGASHDTRIHHSRFRLGRGTAIRSEHDSIVVHNNLIEHNLVNAGSFDLVSVPSEGTTNLTNNTLRDNVMPGAGFVTSLVRLGGLRTPSGYALFENNVLGNNTMCASQCNHILTDSLARIRHNILDTSRIYGSPLFLSDNYNVDPRFAYSAGAHLAADSPARDLGSTVNINGASTDLYGRTRVQNLVVDLGAYELEPVPLPIDVFKDSFE